MPHHHQPHPADELLAQVEAEQRQLRVELALEAKLAGQRFNFYPRRVRTLSRLRARCGHSAYRQVGPRPRGAGHPARRASSSSSTSSADPGDPDPDGEPPGGSLAAELSRIADRLRKRGGVA